MIRQIVISSQTQNGNVRLAKDLSNLAVALGIVLHQVTGQQDAVQARVASKRIGDRRLQSRQTCHASQSSGGIAEEVQVAELQEPNGSHLIYGFPAQSPKKLAKSMGDLMLQNESCETSAVQAFLKGSNPNNAGAVKK